MAFGFFKNFFMTNEEKARVSHIMMLAKTALADGKVDEAETALLTMIAKREGISEKDMRDILDGKRTCAEYTIPKSEDVKIQYLKDMAEMMIVDGVIHEEEVKLCVAVGKKLELPVERIKGILNEVVEKFLTKDLTSTKP